MDILAIPRLGITYFIVTHRIDVVEIHVLEIVGALIVRIAPTERRLHGVTTLIRVGILQASAEIGVFRSPHPVLPVVGMGVPE